MSQIYPINEIFQSLQGEGVFTGYPSIFLRLQGCPVGCPWCDTQQAWDKRDEAEIPVLDLASKRQPSDSWAAMTAAQLLDYFQQQGYQTRHVVITGGEPCLYDLNPLTDSLAQHGYTLQIETSGTFEVNASDASWVTVSPKIDMKGGYAIKPQAMARANEIKHPVAREKDIQQLKALLASHPVGEDVVICLQPVSQKKSATALCVQHCIENNWRLSLQTHKYLGIE